ncbi:ABC transporter ATP-binding protein [Hymenobacter negativus]|uniref:ATP-binding cassette domain-containing protein n=1 Tax=Hymenobacter negativus TaxID=2795026 RepID=A0ABS3QGB3_9BACT|nr:ATP-binding cassette domain-containing protein [Hymenobacter negativus]MBO2010292.1 ATP-binding cassette domain-containing protein [Hymenobacter negativus]
MPDAPPPVIQVTNLHKSFGAQAVVRDVSFAVAAGETLVLLGPSGCGKTTLLKLLNRLIEPDGGTVEINGCDVRQQPPAQLRRGIGYVIQQVGLLPHYTVAENIAVVPKLLGHAPAAIAARTAALLTRLHLPPERYAGQLPQQLSGGQQQRVGLARALAADPPIILMDEPFGALDPITRASIRREFRELDELKRKTVVLVTHDVTEAFELADRIMLLEAGQIQQLGTPRELLFRPANGFVRRFFTAERLALQLRTLTLSDVFAEEEANKLLLEVHNPSLAAQNTLPLSSSTTNSAHTEGSAVNNPEVRVNNQTGSPAILSASKQEVTSKTSSAADFTAATTVQQALETLTGPNAPLASFGVPQLMAAFGEALQREEYAWKR